MFILHENKFISMIGLGTLLIGVLLVTVFQLRFYIRGPYIEIENFVTQSHHQLFQLDAVVHNTQKVLVNGKEIVPQFGGRIKGILALSEGFNTVNLELFDGYGSQKNIYLYITYPQ